MIGTPCLFRITDAQCAREARAGFERGDARVFPRLSVSDENDAPVSVVGATQAGRPSRAARLWVGQMHWKLRREHAVAVARFQNPHISGGWLEVRQARIALRALRFFWQAHW